jgi:hypothetical protein
MGTTTIRGVSVSGAQYGIEVDGGTAIISDSVVRNSSTAIFVEGQTNGTGVLIRRSRMLASSYGLNVDGAPGSAKAFISDCVISGNSTGTLTQSGGQIITLRNNTWLGNSTDGSTPFSISLK